MIAHAVTEYEIAAGRIHRQTEARREFPSMLHATDRALWRLERLNLDREESVPEATRQALREGLSRLPAECMAAYVDRGNVQKTLDSVFEVQERLFALYGRGSGAEESE